MDVMPSNVMRHSGRPLRSEITADNDDLERLRFDLVPEGSQSCTVHDKGHAVGRNWSDDLKDRVLLLTWRDFFEVDISNPSMQKDARLEQGNTRPGCEVFLIVLKANKPTAVHPKAYCRRMIIICNAHARI